MSIRKKGSALPLPAKVGSLRAWELMKLVTELRVFVSGEGVKAEVFDRGQLVESYLVASPIVTPTPVPEPQKKPPTLSDLVIVLKAAQFEFPELKAVCLAQWMIESARGTSRLFQIANNAGGMKWRKEMEGYASPMQYEAHDGWDTYCKFESLEAWIRGYWRFIERAPYAGWREAAKKGPEEYIRFLKASGYAEDASYVSKVISLIPEAEALLGISSKPEIPPGVIDPGHSEKEPGARSNKGAEEENLNFLQAKIIWANLNEKGIKSEIYNPDVDNLESIGKRAKGRPWFVSVHHNKYVGDSDPGTEVFTTRKARPQDVKLAEHILEKICKVLGTKNRGVKQKDYTVITNAAEVCDGPVVLVESYFINPYDASEASQRSSLAAKAIAEAIAEVVQ